LHRLLAALIPGDAKRGYEDVAARPLADVGDVAPFANRNRFAAWTGTAPLDASSGAQIPHGLSRAGNRRMNHVLHIAAIV
jgi:transposase